MARHSGTKASVQAVLDLTRDIQSGRCSMPILIQGEEDYRVEEARRRVIDAFFPDETERQSAVETISARDHDLAGIIARASEAPLFASRRALVVRDVEVLGKATGGEGGDEPDGGRAAGAGKGGRAARKGAAGGSAAAKAGSTWSALPPDAIVILIARPGLDRRTRFYKEIESRGRVLNFDRMEDRGEAAEWIESRVRHRKKLIDPDARALLIEKTMNKGGVSLRLLASEIEKLLAFIGDRPKITRADVELLVGRSVEDQIWSLTDAIGERATGKAVTALHRLFVQEEQALGMLAMLAREFRLLLEARLMLDTQPEARQAARVDYRTFQTRFHSLLKARATKPGAEAPSGELLAGNPYPAWLKLQQAPRFEVPTLLAAIRHLAEADLEIKTGGRHETLVMESLAVKLARGVA